MFYHVFGHFITSFPSFGWTWHLPNYGDPMELNEMTINKYNTIIEYNIKYTTIAFGFK